MRHAHQLAPPVAFLHLTVVQPRRYLPPSSMPPWATHLKPLSKMSCQRVEVQIEPIASEKWKAAWSQALSQRVDEPMSHVLCAGTELKHRQNLRARIHGQPQPEDLFSAAQPCSQFVQLEVWEVEMAEGPRVQRLSVHGLRE